MDRENVKQFFMARIKELCDSYKTIAQENKHAVANSIRSNIVMCERSIGAKIDIKSLKTYLDSETFEEIFGNKK